MRGNTEKEKNRGEAVRSIENLGKGYHLLLLLDNYYLINDDILLLVLFWKFWVLHEIITPYEECAFSEYSEWGNMKKKHNYYLQRFLENLTCVASCRV